MSYPIEKVQDLNQNETVQSKNLNFETVPVTTLGEFKISTANPTNTVEDSLTISVEQISPTAKLFENLNNFKLKYKNDNCLKLDEISNDDLALSFLTHYIAIDLIYSPKVNTKYDELKRNSLKDPEDETLVCSLFDLSNIEIGNFPVEFLSRLRLLIELDKRRIKNGLIEKNNTCWKICETNIFIQTQFNFTYPRPKRRKNENVMMTSSLDSTNFIDYIEVNFKRLTYTQYIKELRKSNLLEILVEKRINITQDAIKSLQDDQKEIFMALWYTIFGVEVSRNPATLIHINMLFDLVQAGIIRWDTYSIIDLFYKFFPMAIAKIVLKAKNLNDYYNDFMPHIHTYDLDTRYDDNINELIKREALITNKWLKFKFKKGKEESEDYSTFENIEKIYKNIHESLNDWKLIF